MSVDERKKDASGPGGTCQRGQKQKRREQLHSIRTQTRRQPQRPRRRVLRTTESLSLATLARTAGVSASQNASKKALTSAVTVRSASVRPLRNACAHARIAPSMKQGEQIRISTRWRLTQAAKEKTRQSRGIHDKQRNGSHPAANTSRNQQIDNHKHTGIRSERLRDTTSQRRPWSKRARRPRRHLRRGRSSRRRSPFARTRPGSSCSA